MKKSAFLTDEEERLYLSMLCSANPALIKRAMQSICLEIERGRIISRRREIVATLYDLKFSKDTKVRGWLYNLIARLRAHDFRDYLIYQILMNEDDEENRTWAVAALFAIAPADQVRAIVSDDSLRFFGSSLELSSLLYSNVQIKGRKSGRELVSLIENDPIIAKWFALLFGYNRVERPDSLVTFPDVELVRSLNSHHNDEVVEYSFWSLHKNPNTTFLDSALTVDKMLDTAPNSRRWAYRLLTKDRRSFIKNKEIIMSSVENEVDELAREGLAQGIEAHYDAELSKHIVSWFSRETSDIVRMPILRHMLQFQKKNGVYREIISEEEERSGHSRLLHDIIGASTGEKSPKYIRGKFSSHAESLQLNFFVDNGRVEMTNTNNTVNNIASGGSKIDAVNTIGDGANIYVRNKGETGQKDISALAAQLIEHINGCTDIDSDSREIVQQAANDAAGACSSSEEDVAWAKKLKRAIATLSGVASELPNVSESASKIKEFVNSAKDMFL